MQKEDLQRWVKASKDKAQYLLAQVEDLAKAVFVSQKEYISFLDLTARIHHYDANNLLLIWHACPSACYLAGYKVWERQLPAGAQVLKKEHMGNGIDLVAPFTDGINEQASLVWHSRAVFDGSQTTSVLQPPSFDPVYISDHDHRDFLMDAIQTTLATKYQRRLIVGPPSQIQQDTGLPGGITDQFITARSDIGQMKLLQWLTEAMAHLTIRDNGLSAPSERLLENSICYCLFQIWGLEDAALRPGTDNQLQNVVNQILFLNLLRDNVRELNNLVGSFYMARRQDEEENTLDLDDIFDIPPQQG